MSKLFFPVSIKVGSTQTSLGEVRFETSTNQWSFQLDVQFGVQGYPASSYTIERCGTSTIPAHYRIPSSYDTSGNKKVFSTAQAWNQFLVGALSSPTATGRKTCEVATAAGTHSLIQGLSTTDARVRVTTSDPSISASITLPYDSGGGTTTKTLNFTASSSDSLKQIVKVSVNGVEVSRGASPLAVSITAVSGEDKQVTLESVASHSTVTIQGMYSAIRAIGYNLPYSNTAEGSQNISATIYSDDSSYFDVYVDNVRVSEEGGVVGYGLEETVAVGTTKQIEIRRATSDLNIQRDYANRWDIRFVSALGKWQQLILPVDVFEEGVPTQYPGSGSIQLPMALNQPIIDQWVQVSFSGMDAKAVQPGTYQIQVLASDSTRWVPFANFDFDGALITKVQHFGGVAAGLILPGPTTQQYREIRIWAIAATIPEQPPQPTDGETPLPRPDPLPSEPETPTPIQPEGPVTPITEPVEPDPEGTPIEPIAPTPTETTIPTPDTQVCVCSPWYASIAQAIVNSGAYISQAVRTIISPLIQGVSSVEKLRYELVSAVGQFLHQVEGIKLSLEALRADLCKGVNAISPEIEKVEARLDAIQNDLYARLGEIKEDIHSIDSRLYLMDGDIEVSITDELGNISSSIENPAGLIQQEISCGVDASGVLNVTTKSINEMES